MVFIVQVAGVHKDSGGEDSGDVRGTLQRDLARGTLESAVPNREPVKSQGIPDLTLFPPGHVQGVLGIALECWGGKGSVPRVNRALSPFS